MAPMEDEMMDEDSVIENPPSDDGASEPHLHSIDDEAAEQIAQWWLAEAWKDANDGTESAIEAVVSVIQSGGALVSAAQCSEAEISLAKKDGRLWVFPTGVGVVRRPAEWLRGVTGEGSSGEEDGIES